MQGTSANNRPVRPQGDAARDDAPQGDAAQDDAPAADAARRDAAQGDAAAEALVLLFSRVIRRWKAHGPPQALDPAAFVVLHEAHTRGPLRVSDLAAALHLDVSTVSRHVRNLEVAGHLHRTDDPDDRRACRLALTASGQRLHTEIHERRAQVLSGAMAHWSERDRRQLLRLLERLADDLARDEPKERTP